MVTGQFMQISFIMHYRISVYRFVCILIIVIGIISHELFSKEYVGDISDMQLKKLIYDFSVCKVEDISGIDFNKEFCFYSKTDEELSLVCPTKDVPGNTIERDDGWKGFRIEGVLDFSLIGILSKISRILAENKIGIFVVSTYNTDYIFVKEENFENAMTVLEKAGYTVI